MFTTLLTFTGSVLQLINGTKRSTKLHTGKFTDGQKQNWQTHRKQELLDLLHGVGHAQVSLGHRRKNLDEHVQLHGEVGILGLTAFPQPLLLKEKPS